MTLSDIGHLKARLFESAVDMTAEAYKNTQMRGLTGLLLAYCLSLPAAAFVWLAGLSPSLAISNSLVSWVYGGVVPALLAGYFARRINKTYGLDNLGLSGWLFGLISWLGMLPIILVVGAWVLYYVQMQG